VPQDVLILSGKSINSSLSLFRSMGKSETLRKLRLKQIGFKWRLERSEWQQTYYFG